MAWLPFGSWSSNMELDGYSRLLGGLINPLDGCVVRCRSAGFGLPDRSFPKAFAEVKSPCVGKADWRREFRQPFWFGHLVNNFVNAVTGLGGEPA
ncbi:unnamed protein product [Prunus armeniaca]|uniref:Uncharacterized protein n=1 Tax=Prunus armeniaca TaxID=36596 RepID=A0A6J5W144_PRUAR|nr:unnamed protein product [Prunus armeniaca]CAB4295290.1 unnamed protein product [Prunus armeniaca]